MSRSTHNKDYQLLIEVLRKYRKESGYTQEEIAALIGVPQDVISKCESGVRRLDCVELAELAEAMGADPAELYAEFLSRRTPGLHPKLRRFPPTDPS